MLYRIIVFLHIIFTFGFLLSHGASVSMAFTLKRERDAQKIRVLLNLSGASYPLMSLTLLASIVFGIIAGFQVIGGISAGSGLLLPCWSSSSSL